MLNPAGTVPVLVEHDGPAISGAWAISEYLDETRGFALDRAAAASGQCRAARRGAAARASGSSSSSTRRSPLSGRGEGDQAREARKAGGNGGAPDSSLLRAARANIRTHLLYIEHLIAAKNWLAGDRMSYADLAAAAALSVADYLGEVPWQDASDAKDWYMRMKSRPAFRPLLAEQVRGHARRSTTPTWISEAGRSSAALIEELARAEGFDAIGVTTPDAIPTGCRPPDGGDRRRASRHDGLARRHVRRRGSPAALWPEVRSVIMLGMNYGPEGDPLATLANAAPATISVYARNRDYHDLIKGALKRIATQASPRAPGRT